MVKTIKYKNGLEWEQILSNKRDFRELNIPFQIGKALSLHERQGEELRFSMILNKQTSSFKAKITSGRSFRPPMNIFKQLQPHISAFPTRSAQFKVIDHSRKKPVGDPPEVEGFTPEGAKRIASHVRWERNNRLLAEKRRSLIDSDGRLTCEMCGFEFIKQYGALGMNFIEIHHLTPLSVRREKRVTLLNELVGLCSNCHRMSHRLIGKDVSVSNRGSLRENLFQTDTPKDSGRS